MSSIYLSTFLIYLALVLTVGVFASRKSSLSSFAVAGRKMSLGIATGTFMASFVSGVTVIGVSGYASRFGWSAAAFSCYGYALGWILLVAIGGRLYRSELNTVPAYFEQRYKSGGLRIYAAIVIIFLYSIVVMVQLLAMEITLHTLTGISGSLVICVVGAAFTTYTMLGGLAAVVRTQLIQIVVLGCGLLLGATMVIQRTHGAVFTPPPSLGHFFAGQVGSVGDFVGWILVWGLGIPTESYYLHRFYSAESADVARKQIGVGAVLIMLLLLAVIICGVGAGMLVPKDQLGDSALPYLFKTVIGGWICVPILLVIMSAVQSSASGLLHIVGLYFAMDIYKQVVPERTDAQLLRMSRTATCLFGVSVTAGALYLSMHTLPLIGVIAGISWGGMASTMFVPIFAGLFWPSATRLGAISSSVGGLFGVIASFTAKRAGWTSLHEIYGGLFVSALLMFVVSMCTRRSMTNPTSAHLGEVML